MTLLGQFPKLVTHKEKKTPITAITVNTNVENSFNFYEVVLSSDIVPFTHQSYVGYTNYLAEFLLLICLRKNHFMLLAYCSTRPSFGLLYCVLKFTLPKSGLSSFTFWTQLLLFTFNGFPTLYVETEPLAARNVRVIGPESK